MYFICLIYFYYYIVHAPPPVSISKTAPNMLPQTPLWNKTQTTTPNTKNAPPKKKRRADGIKGVGEKDISVVGA